MKQAILFNIICIIILTAIFMLGFTIGKMNQEISLNCENLKDWEEVCK